MERRGQVTRVLTNYGQLETGGTEWLERKVKPSLSGTSRVTGDSQARFCEGLGVKFPGPTRPGLSPKARCRINQGKIKPAMSHEFFEEADELEPQAGSSRSGGPPRKTTLAGVLNPQNCPRCGRRIPSQIEESAMRKTRAKAPNEWEKLRKRISSKVCTCLEPTWAIASEPTWASKRQRA